MGRTRCPFPRAITCTSGASEWVHAFVHEHARKLPRRMTIIGSRFLNRALGGNGGWPWSEKPVERRLLATLLAHAI